jgi:hypothetical protein
MLRVLLGATILLISIMTGMALDFDLQAAITKLLTESAKNEAAHAKNEAAQEKAEVARLHQGLQLESLNTSFEALKLQSDDISSQIKKEAKATNQGFINMENEKCGQQLH